MSDEAINSALYHLRAQIIREDSKGLKEVETLLRTRGCEVNAFQVPSNKGAQTSESAPDMSLIKLIDYDFKKYGSSDERKRLLQKWDEEVSVLPQ